MWCDVCDRQRQCTINSPWGAGFNASNATVDGEGGTRTYGYGRLHAQLPIRGSLYSSTWRVSACQSVSQTRGHTERVLPTPTRQHGDTPTRRRSAGLGLKRPTQRSANARPSLSRSRAGHRDEVTTRSQGRRRVVDVRECRRRPMNHRHTHEVRVIFSLERCDSQIRKPRDEEVRLVLVLVPPQQSLSESHRSRTG